MTHDNTSSDDHYLLSVQEAAEMLDIGEDELWKLVREHVVPTHNLAGAFVRFKKKDIEDLKIKWRIQRELFPEPGERFPHQAAVRHGSILENIADFWYFNDFYILCSLLIVALLYFILTTR